MCSRGAASPAEGVRRNGTPLIAEPTSAPSRPRHARILKPGDSEFPEDMLNPSTLKHTDMQFESVIRQPLWEEAHWRGIGYAAETGQLPWMVLVFEHEKPAVQLMSALVAEVGQKDPEDKLRIVIVKGIDSGNPHHYRALIGSNPDFEDSTKLSMMMMQIHEMRPQSGENLSRFLTAYALTGHTTWEWESRPGPVLWVPRVAEWPDS